MSSQTDQIILVLEERGGVMQGTEELAIALNALNCKSYVIRAARRLAQNGLIVIRKSNGGRGNKTTYKKRKPMRRALP